MSMTAGADLGPTRTQVARIAAAIVQEIVEWTAQTPEERARRWRADFSESMEARGIRGHFVDDTDEFIITEMPRPVEHITISQRIAIEFPGDTE